MIRTIFFMCTAFLLTLFLSISAQAAATDADDKVLVVMVYDGGCHMWCDEVRPIISSVTKQYDGKVVLRELDVQDSALKDSLGKADGLGVKSFVEGALARVPTVGVFTQKRKLVRAVPGVKKGDTYKKYIEQALKSG